MAVLRLPLDHLCRAVAVDGAIDLVRHDPAAGRRPLASFGRAVRERLAEGRHRYPETTTPTNLVRGRACDAARLPWGSAAGGGERAGTRTTDLIPMQQLHDHSAPTGHGVRSAQRRRRCP